MRDTGYVLDQFFQLPLNDDHLHRDPDYPWEAYLQAQAKVANRGREESVCPEEPQKGLSSLAERLKMPLPTSIPKFRSPG